MVVCPSGSVGDLVMGGDVWYSLCVDQVNDCRYPQVMLMMLMLIVVDDDGDCVDYLIW